MTFFTSFPRIGSWSCCVYVCCQDRPAALLNTHTGLQYTGWNSHIYFCDQAIKSVHIHTPSNQQRFRHRYTLQKHFLRTGSGSFHVILSHEIGFFRNRFQRDGMRCHDAPHQLNLSARFEVVLNRPSLSHRKIWKGSGLTISFSVQVSKRIRTDYRYPTGGKGSVLTIYPQWEWNSGECRTSFCPAVILVHGKAQFHRVLHTMMRVP